MWSCNELFILKCPHLRKEDHPETFKNPLFLREGLFQSKGKGCFAALWVQPFKPESKFFQETSEPLHAESQQSILPLSHPILTHLPLASKHCNVPVLTLPRTSSALISQRNLWKNWQLRGELLFVGEMFSSERAQQSHYLELAHICWNPRQQTLPPLILRRTRKISACLIQLQCYKVISIAFLVSLMRQASS